jgi:hypothetical protein
MKRQKLSEMKVTTEPAVKYYSYFLSDTFPPPTCEAEASAKSVEEKT